MKVAQKISRNTFVSNLLKLDLGGGGGRSIALDKLFFGADPGFHTKLCWGQ